MDITGDAVGGGHQGTGISSLIHDTVVCRPLVVREVLRNHLLSTRLRDARS